MEKKKNTNDLVVFFICSFSLVTIFICVFYFAISSNRVKNETGSADGRYTVDAAALLRDGKSVLRGDWEYYSGVHIVSGGERPAQPTGVSSLPMAWSMFDKSAWGADGMASYRLILENLPDESLVFYLNGISPSVEIFVDGEKDSGSGYGLNTGAHGAFISGGGRREIVIEVSGEWLTGVYACPWLYLSGDFQNHMNLTNSIWMVSLGCFAAAFLMGMVLLRKLRVKKQYYQFMRSFVSIGLFYLCANYETSNGVMRLYSYISFEQTHLLVTALAVFLGVSTVRLQVTLYPGFFEKKATYALAFALFASILLKLVIGAYVDMDILTVCLVVVFAAYQIIFTVIGMRDDRSIVYISAATLLVGIGIAVSAITSTQHVFYGVYVLLPGTLLGAILLYTNFWAMTFASIEEAAARESEMKQELMNAEIAYLTSQIQPHFQYNTLTMIQELCYTDAQKAADAIVKFSALLRRRVDFNKYEKLVPFSDELECINDYIAIQKLRFDKTICFDFDIETEDFLIPPLSVQTLMENAVHHGLRKSATGGGSIKLSVHEGAEGIEICVEDDGAGFDVGAFDPEGPGNGIVNCRFRIESLLNGKVQIQSEIGCGTKVTIAIPRARPEGGELL